DMNSATSQFFIVQEDSTELDGKYAAFGHIIKGMDIVDEICDEAQPTDDNGTISTSNQPIITSIVLVN
ncbi:peptidylprolyl isomerase, partial [bacterium]|nr:peptidylprolyl isomerase [bacterium]